MLVSNIIHVTLLESGVPEMFAPNLMYLSIISLSFVCMCAFCILSLTFSYTSFGSL